MLNPEDLPAILSIERASFPGCPWTLEGFLAEMERQFSAVLGLFPPVRSMTPAPPSGGGGGFPPSPLAAFAVFWLLEGETHLMRLAVAPERRREGLGRTLLDAVLSASAAKGMERAVLEVRENNPAALSLYRSRGFRVTGRRRGYYEDGRTDALTMTLDLVPRGLGGGPGPG